MARSSLVVTISNAVSSTGLMAHHFVQVPFQQADVDKPGVQAGDVEPSGTVHLDAGCGRDGQRAVPQLHERDAARVAGPGALEHLLGFHIEKPQLAKIGGQT